MKAYLSIFGLLAVLLPLSAKAADEVPARFCTFDSAGVKIAYVEAGKGPDVILVHGLYSSAGINWMMPGTFNLLAQHYHVVALDLRGHGLSDKPTDDASYGQPMVEDIAHLMDHLKIPRAHIAGYSLGGIIVMKFMVDHPERVISANLGGMGWLRDGSVEQRIFVRMGDRSGKAVLGTPPACAGGIAKLAVTETQIKKIKVPVEILVGDRDPCNAMYVQPLQPLRPDWPVLVIPDAGHLTCIVKDQFKTDLAKWIDANAK
jgi:pimeloyl-ACP methyl ester carboxylesterase